MQIAKSWILGILYFWFLCPNNVGFEFVLLSIDMQLHSKDFCTRYIWSPSWLIHVVQWIYGHLCHYVTLYTWYERISGPALHGRAQPRKGLWFCLKACSSLLEISSKTSSSSMSCIISLVLLLYTIVLRVFALRGRAEFALDIESHA